MTREEVQAKHDARKQQSISNRRKYVDGCNQCRDNREKRNGHGTWHDASERCGCGYFEHCSCSSCW